MKVPPWLEKNWPFVAAGVIFVFLAIQLSRAGGCANPPPPPPEQHWPKQVTPKHLK